MLTEEHRRHRVARVQPVRHDELHAVQTVLTVRQPLVKQDLRLLDIGRRREKGAIHVVISHRAALRVNRALGHSARIAGGDGRVEIMKPCRRRPEVGKHTRDYGVFRVRHARLSSRRCPTAAGATRHEHANDGPPNGAAVR